MGTIGLIVILVGSVIVIALVLGLSPRKGRSSGGKRARSGAEEYAETMLINESSRSDSTYSGVPRSGGHHHHSHHDTSSSSGHHHHSHHDTSSSSGHHHSDFSSGSWSGHHGGDFGGGGHFGGHH